jgi:hypothetical protein
MKKYSRVMFLFEVKNLSPIFKAILDASKGWNNFSPVSRLRGYIESPQGAQKLADLVYAQIGQPPGVWGKAVSEDRKMSLLVKLLLNGTVSLAFVFEEDSTNYKTFICSVVSQIGPILINHDDFIEVAVV